MNCIEATLGKLKTIALIVLTPIRHCGGTQILTLILAATAGAILGIATAETSLAQGKFGAQSHTKRLPRLCCYIGASVGSPQTRLWKLGDQQASGNLALPVRKELADGFAPFPTAFDRAVFCVNAIPIVSNIIGKEWSAKELADKFRGAVDLAISEGHKRGLSEVQIARALDNEAARQESLSYSDRYREIVALYQHCPR